MLGRITRWSAALAAPIALVSAVFTPAHALAFKTVSWKDPSGDSTTLVVNGLDNSTDILASQISSNRGEIDALTTMGQVTSTPPLSGTGLVVQTFFTFSGHTYYLEAERTPLGDSFSLRWLDTTQTPHKFTPLPCPDCSGKFDSSNNTISFKVPMKTLNAALASQHVPAIGKGAKLTALETDSEVFRGVPVKGVIGLVSVADTSTPTDPHTALVIP